jgi:hypothetical protein
MSNYHKRRKQLDKRRNRLGEHGYIFTCRGIVQHWDDGTGKQGMMFATNYAAAQALATRMIPPHGGKMSIAAIGSIPGETLMGQYRESIAFGANGIWATDDGDAFYFFVPKGMSAAA